MADLYPIVGGASDLREKRLPRSVQPREGFSCCTGGAPATSVALGEMEAMPVRTTFRPFRGEADYPVMVRIMNACNKDDRLNTTSR